MLNMGVVFVWSWFAKMYGREDHRLPTGYRPNAILTVVPLVSLIIVAGLRYKVGTDYHTYMLLYELAAKYENIWEIFGFGTAKASTDPGFTALLWLLNQISHDPQIMFATVAAITYIFIVKTLYMFGRPFELSMFLLIGMFHYYASFNGIRQYMVAGILFWAVKYLINGNWVRYTIIVLICSLFHSSALIMIPVYFIVRRKAWSPVLGCLTLLFLAGSFLYQKFLSVFLVVLENSSYGHYEEWLTRNSNGMNSIKIIVLLLPLVLAFCFRSSCESAGLRSIISSTFV